MSDFATHCGRFVVLALRNKGLIQQTRVKAASAVVLAQKWRAAGYSKVTIFDPTGRQLEPESYGINASRNRQCNL
jgi:hypothetical protein